MVDATVRIVGRNELGRAVAAAERDLKRLVTQGQVVGRIFRGGAIAAAVLSFERLAEAAEKASIAIGDKGTAASLAKLNSEIDRLKAKGLNVIGQVLGAGRETFFGTDLEKQTSELRSQIKGVEQQLAAIKEGRFGASLFGSEWELNQRLAELKQQLAAITPQASEAARALARMRAISRGGGSGVLVKTDFGTPRELFPDVVTARRAVPTGLAAFYADLERETRTSTQKILAEWEALELAVKELQKSGVISATEAAKRLGDISTRFLEPIEITAQRIEPAVKQIEGLWLHMAENMQDAFADFLATSEGDLDDWAASFINTLRQVVAQAAAFEFFSFLGTVPGLGFLTPRQHGGPVRAGGSYLVGERGPEWFVPGSSGQIIPDAGGGLVIAPVMNVDARGATTDLLKVLPAVLEQHKRETVALTVQTVRNRVSRTGHL